MSDTAIMPDLKVQDTIDNSEDTALEETHLRHSRAGFKSVLTRTKNELSSLLNDPDNLDTVKIKLDELADAWNKFQVAHFKIAPQIDTERQYFEKENKTVSDLQERVRFWIVTAEMNLIEPKDSVSQTSRKSASTTYSSEIERQRLAEFVKRKTLEMKLDRMRQEQELAEKKIKAEINMKQIAFEEKLLQTKMDLAEATVREQAYEEASIIASRHSSMRSRKSCSHVETTHNHQHDLLRRSEQNPAAASARSTRYQSQDVVAGNVGNMDTPLVMVMKMMETIVQDQRQSTLALTLPTPELPIFDGNPIDYCTFVNAFETLIERRTESNNSRLHYLIQYTRGDVQDLIKSCLTMKAEEGYKQAKRLLKKTYGQDYKIATALVDRVTNGPVIRSDEGQALHKYSVLLLGCNNTLNHIGYASKIDNPENMKAVINRLPYDLRKKWRNKADSISEIDERDITFQDIVYFVEREARAASHPIFGDLSKPVPQKTTHNTILAKTKNSSFATSSQSYTTQKLNPTAPSYMPTNQRFGQGSHSAPNYIQASQKPSHGNNVTFTRKCCLCDKDHRLDECLDFLRKPYPDRHAFAQKNGLYFNCLIPRHRVKDCRKRPMCSTCGKKHATLLHRPDDVQHQSHMHSTVNPGNEFKTELTNSYIDTHEGTTNSCVKTGSSIALPIVLVKVKATSSDDPVYTYAFLDSGSNSTFCTDALLKKLDIKGRKVKFSLTTLEKENSASESQIVSLQVYDLDETHFIDLPTVFSRPVLPISTDDISRQHDVDRWPHLKGIQLQSLDTDVGLLIGNNNIAALEPQEIRSSRNGGPYAVKTRFGWVINGPIGHGETISKCSANFVKGDVVLEQQFREYCNREFSDSIVDTEREMSKDDKKALQIMESSIMYKDGHYHMALPFKETPALPDNRSLAEHRLTLLKRRLDRNAELYDKYSRFMDDLHVKNYSEIVPDDELGRSDGAVWYLPHHPVFHPKKPNKVRVVFDCSAKYRDQSLNDNLLTGPDQTNSLIGVLLRFRQDPVALISDIEAMFHQVRVLKENRDVFRFLWWTDGLGSQPRVYRMRVHLFGAASSPSCCNYALRRTAEDHRNEYDDKTIATVKNNFYVDDCLKSVANEEEAIELIKQLNDLLRKGGFRLTKWATNSLRVMETIPSNERAATMKDIDFSTHPVEHTLGMQWDISLDAFRFKITFKARPLTRRGILSMISAVYDPLGFITPVMLPVKLMLQEFCRMELGWDDPIPEHYVTIWKKWLDELWSLTDFSIARCVKSSQLLRSVSCELHHFSDASESAYGTVSYLRFTDSNKQIHCSFVMGKSRVASLKKITIPRLELSAATLAVRQDKMIRQELEIPVKSSIFWTDSTSVLKFIQNRDKRFHTFVANRIAVIQDGSDVSSWRYVTSMHNPADDASRGLNARELVEGCRWSIGPRYLWEHENDWPKQPQNMGELPPDHPEVKPVMSCQATKTEIPQHTGLNDLLTRFSSWHQLKKFFAWIIRYKSNLQAAARDRKMGNPWKKKNSNPVKPVTLEEMKAAEHEIVRIAQRQCYPEEIAALSKITDSSRRPVKKTSSLYRLNPIIKDGILRVGGRLTDLRLNGNLRLQYILPRNHPVAGLIIQHFHHISGHSGREYVLGLIRTKFWITQGNSAVRRVLSKCVRCRKTIGQVEQQKMADLPIDRLTPDKPPFTYVGIDFFGPYMVKRARSQVKRYGLLFTCLTTRALHIEVTHSLDTESFLNGMSRFIARRGKPEEIRSDNGGCFIKGEREIRTSIAEWNQNVIHDHLLQKEIKWTFNPPLGSHHGGIWERCIRTVRKILSSLLTQQILDDEGLVTLMCEVETIMNGRPITKVSDDPLDCEALTPNHLLLFQNGPFTPLGSFSRHTSYYQRRWHQIQYLANQFWRRWIREYLSLLQRQKWNNPTRNLEVGDLVLLVDNTTPRNTWPLGRVVEVFPGRDQLVRRVRVRAKSAVYDRPIDKLIVLDTVHNEHV